MSWTPLGELLAGTDHPRSPAAWKLARADSVHPTGEALRAAGVSVAPYWGAQATYWLNANASWGLGIDYTHSKAYAALNFATDPVYRHLEFTDGNNLLLLNLLYRFDPLADGRLVPYLGVGGGVAIPHVEVKLNAFPGQDTWEYQFAGGAAQVLGGLEYRLNDAPGRSRRQASLATRTSPRSSMAVAP